MPTSRSSLPEDLDKAIQVVYDSLESHLQFLSRDAYQGPAWEPGVYTAEEAWGDLEFHAETIVGYAFVIGVLKRAREKCTAPSI